VAAPGGGGAGACAGAAAPRAAAALTLSASSALASSRRSMADRSAAFCARRSRDTARARPAGQPLCRRPERAGRARQNMLAHVRPRARAAARPGAVAAATPRRRGPVGRTSSWARGGSVRDANSALDRDTGPRPGAVLVRGRRRLGQDMLSTPPARGRGSSSAPARAPALVAAQAGRRVAKRQARGRPRGAATLVRGALALGGGACGQLQRVALGGGRARGGALGGGLRLQPRGALGGRQRIRQPHLGCYVYPVTYPIQPHLSCYVYPVTYPIQPHLGLRGLRLEAATAGRAGIAAARAGSQGWPGGRSVRGGRRRARPPRSGTSGAGSAGAAGARLQAVREPLLRDERGGGGRGLPLRGRRRGLRRRRRRCRAAAALGGLVPACGALRGHRPAMYVRRVRRWARRARAYLQMREA